MSKKDRKSIKRIIKLLNEVAYLADNTEGYQGIAPTAAEMADDLMLRLVTED